MQFGFLKLGARLRNKILVGVAIVALIPFITAGIFALYVINRAHNADVLSVEKNLLNQKAVETKNFVSDSVNLLEIILPLPIEGIVIALRPQDKVVAGEPLKVLKNGERIKFLVDPGSLDDVLTDSLTTNPALSELYFVDKSGMVVSYKSRSPNTPTAYFPYGEFADLSKLPQFQAAANGEKYVSEVNFTLEGPIVNVASPVKNRDGKIVGVLVGELNLSGLKKVFEQTVIGASGYVYLLDSSGNLLYNSDPNKLPRTNLGASTAIPDFEKENNVLAGFGQKMYTSAWGEEVVATASLVSLTGKIEPWVLVAEWPTSDANKVIDTLRTQFIFFLLTVLVLTVFFSLFLANRIAKPISILQIGTERIASGIFDAPVDIHTKDELEDLGMAFNKMMKGLKQLQELKDEFVFIAAHELRTPVAAIKGYLSMIMDGDVGKIDDAAKEFIKKVINANQRLIQLVNDLLQVARSEAGRLTIQVAAIDIVEPIKSVLDELKPLVQEKNIKMVYEPGNSFKALADAVRLKEVVVNLVGNAIKYMGDSPVKDSHESHGAGGTVTISHEVKDNTVITHIADTGLGISEEAQKKLFEKFYRVQTDKTREITGTGLGLFIVKQIVEKMSGKIWVESVEGKGSTFSFSLPVAQ
ncbi:MAG: sensor histidine kinase [bacterium]|nr:sensor histidine kinase [bacterium]